MQKRVWFAHGKIIDGIYCPYCDRHRTCRLIRETFRWRGLLSCGHVRAQIGLTLPYKELVRKGFINRQDTSEDPRSTARKKQLFYEAMSMRQKVLDEKRISEQLAGGKQYL